MVHHPGVYARLLGEKIHKHDVKCWLVNTGWTGGPYGIGKRIQIKYTRAMLTAALDGRLDNIEYEKEPYFNLIIPKECPDITSEILNPKNTFSDKNAYDEGAKKLANMFIENFKEYESSADENIRQAGPNKL